MEINIEKFICDCIEKAERAVTWEYIDENIDGHIFKGALREQGLEYKNGKIVKIGEKPKEAEKKLFLIYDMDNDKFEATSDEPELKGNDIFCPVDGTPYLIRLYDYHAHLAHDIATKFLKKEGKDE